LAFLTQGCGTPPSLWEHALQRLNGIVVGDACGRLLLLLLLLLLLGAHGCV